MPYHHHFHHKIHLLKDELSEVYASLLMKFFALNLVNIFVPIYLLTLGFPFKDILYFFLVLSLVIVIVSPFSAYISQYFGFNVSLLLSAPFLMVYILGLYSIPSLNLTFPLIHIFAVMHGISAALYWIPLNSIFAIHSDKLHRGVQVGKLFIFPRLPTLIAPTLGGIIAIFFGFPVLFLLVAFLLVLSIAPLFFGKENMKPHVKFSFKKMFSKSHMPFLFAFMANGVLHNVSGVFWPLFVYLLLNDTLAIGLIATIATIGTLIFTYFVGRGTDHANRRLILKVGGALFAISWFIRPFLETRLEVFVLSFLAGMFVVLITIPFNAIWLDKANTENPTEFVVFREVGLCLGRIFIMLIGAMVVKTFLVSFSLAGVASLFFMFF